MLALQIPVSDYAALIRSTGLIDALPASAVTRPIPAMHTAETKFIRQPHRNRYVLRPNAYYGHHGSAARIDPVVLRAIAISRNNIGVPVRSWPYYGHPDERPFPCVANGVLRMRCASQCAQATQEQGRSQSYDHIPHAWPPCRTQFSAFPVVMESEPGFSLFVLTRTGMCPAQVRGRLFVRKRPRELQFFQRSSNSGRPIQALLRHRVAQPS